MTIIDAVMRRIEAIALFVAACCALVIAAAMAAQVFWRYVLGDPLLWSERLSVYALVWLVFLGAAVITARWDHVSISSFVDLLPAPLRAIAALLGKLAMAVFAVAVLIVGFDNLMTGAHAREPVMGISTVWVKAIISVSAGAMVLFSVSLALRDLCNIVLRRWDRFPRTARDLPDASADAPEPERPV
jgi:TRAP-type C4-dicarboxylate transport system permease small subunit